MANANSATIRIALDKVSDACRALRHNKFQSDQEEFETVEDALFNILQVLRIMAAKPITADQIIEIDEEGNVHGDIPGVKRDG